MATTHAARDTGKRRQHGLTLLELAIVVAITAIVAAAAAPSFTALIDARRLDSAATRLAADIQLARSEAIARNQPLRLSLFTGTGASCWIVHSGAAGRLPLRRRRRRGVRRRRPHGQGRRAREQASG